METREQYLHRSLQNTIAYQKRHTEAGLCPCGRERREGKAKCQKCADDRKAWYEKNKFEILTDRKKSWKTLKKKVLIHYGGICQCCGEDWLDFLVLDHIDGGGTKHRKEVVGNTGSNNLYSWIVRNNYPPLFQVLCANCNTAKGADNKECIHSKYMKRG